MFIRFIIIEQLEEFTIIIRNLLINMKNHCQERVGVQEGASVAMQNQQTPTMNGNGGGIKNFQYTPSAGVQQQLLQAKNATRGGDPTTMNAVQVPEPAHHNFQYQVAAPTPKKQESVRNAQYFLEQSTNKYPPFITSEPAQLISRIANYKQDLIWGLASKITIKNHVNTKKKSGKIQKEVSPRAPGKLNSLSNLGRDNEGYCVLYQQVLPHKNIACYDSFIVLQLIDPIDTINEQSLNLNTHLINPKRNDSSSKRGNLCITGVLAEADKRQEIQAHSVRLGAGSNRGVGGPAADGLFAHNIQGSRVGGIIPHDGGEFNMNQGNDYQGAPQVNDKHLLGQQVTNKYQQEVSLIPPSRSKADSIGDQQNERQQMKMDLESDIEGGLSRQMIQPNFSGINSNFGSGAKGKKQNAAPQDVNVMRESQSGIGLAEQLFGGGGGKAVPGNSNQKIDTPSAANRRAAFKNKGPGGLSADAVPLRANLLKNANRGLGDKPGETLWLDVKLWDVRFIEQSSQYQQQQNQQNSQNSRQNNHLFSTGIADRKDSQGGQEGTTQQESIDWQGRFRKNSTNLGGVFEQKSQEKNSMNRYIIPALDTSKQAALHAQTQLLAENGAPQPLNSASGVFMPKNNVVKPITPVSGSFKISMRPFLSELLDSYFQIDIELDDRLEYTHIQALLQDICIISTPSLDEDYRFVQNIGKGSQATVDLYKQRIYKQPKLALQAQLTTTPAIGNGYGSGSNKEPHQQCSSSALMIAKQTRGGGGGGGNNNTNSPPSEDGEAFAVKKILVELQSEDFDSQRDVIVNEITFLRELKMCDNIVELHAVYLHKKNELKASSQVSHNNLQARDESQEACSGTVYEVCLVMKFAKYGSILQHLRTGFRNSEEQIRTIMAQLLLALDLIHRKKIIHRDIKPDNILIVDKNELKICISDLGLACRSDDLEEISIKCGTPGYVAPEVLRGGIFTPKSDIFSAGSLFYNFVAMSCLFQGRDCDEMLLANSYQDPIPTVQLKVNGVSPECKSLLMWMVQRDPDMRPTAEQCIQHEWFAKDREALQSSLLLNKNPDIIATLVGGAQNASFSDNNQNNYGSSGKNLLQNFRYAPNYYEMVHQLSSIENICRPSSSNRDRSPSQMLQMVKAGLVGGGTGGAIINSNSNILKEQCQSMQDSENGAGVQAGQSNVSGLGQAFSIQRDLIYQNNQFLQINCKSSQQFQRQRSDSKSALQEKGSGLIVGGTTAAAINGPGNHLDSPCGGQGNSSIAAHRMSVRSNHSSQLNLQQFNNVRFCYNQIITRGRELSNSASRSDLQSNNTRQRVSSVKEKPNANPNNGSGQTPMSRNRGHSLFKKHTPVGGIGGEITPNRNVERSPEGWNQVNNTINQDEKERGRRQGTNSHVYSSGAGFAAQIDVSSNKGGAAGYGQLGSQGSPAGRNAHHMIRSNGPSELKKLQKLDEVKNDSKEHSAMLKLAMKNTLKKGASFDQKPLQQAAAEINQEVIEEEQKQKILSELPQSHQQPKDSQKKESVGLQQSKFDTNLSIPDENLGDEDGNIRNMILLGCAKPIHPDVGLGANSNNYLASNGKEAPYSPVNVQALQFKFRNEKSLTSMLQAKVAMRINIDDLYSEERCMKYKNSTVAQKRNFLPN